MKIMAKWLIALLVVVLAVASAFLLLRNKVEHGEIKYNNSDLKHVAVSLKVKPDKMEEFLAEVDAGKQVSLVDLCSQFTVQCVRKTHQGYYVVLGQDDNKFVFLMMNDDMTVKSWIRTGRTVEASSAMQGKLEQLNTLGEMKAKAPNMMVLPSEQETITATLTADGVYLRHYTGEGDDAQVTATEFLTRDEMLNSTDELVRSWVPYLVESDLTGKEARK